MLKSEIETLKRENSKLKHDMCEKEILIKRQTAILAFLSKQCVLTDIEKQ